MADKGYLELACDYLKVKAEDILGYHIYDAEIVLIVNKGIEGAPKVVIPLVELGAKKAATAPPAPVDPIEAEAKKVDRFTPQRGKYK